MHLIYSSKSSTLLGICVTHLPKMNSDNVTVGISTINLKNHWRASVLDKMQQRYTALSHWIQLQSLDRISKTVMWRLQSQKQQMDLASNNPEQWWVCFGPDVDWTLWWRSSHEGGQQTEPPLSGQEIKKEKLRELDSE